MTDAEPPSTSDGERSLGELFVDVTGETTVTERQDLDASRRAAAGTTEAALVQYLVAATKADGLTDAVEVPGVDWDRRAGNGGPDGRE